METILVRLTKSEFEYIRGLKVGNTFQHINLEHSHTIFHDDLDKEHIAIQILKSGNINSEPILNWKDTIPLKLLKLTTDLSFSDVKDYQDIPLADNRGVLHSIYARYNPVFGYTMEELKNMKYYVREFKVI